MGPKDAQIVTGWQCSGADGSSCCTIWPVCGTCKGGNCWIYNSNAVSGDNPENALVPAQPKDALTVTGWQCSGADGSSCCTIWPVCGTCKGGNCWIYNSNAVSGTNDGDNSGKHISLLVTLTTARDTVIALLGGNHVWVLILVGAVTLVAILLGLTIRRGLRKTRNGVSEMDGLLAV